MRHSNRGFGRVGVHVVAAGPGGFRSKPLLKAICDNAWLDLAYLGPDLPKHLAEHFQGLQAER